jgi:hypothetical protein
MAAVSLVKALQDFFTKDPNGRKIEMSEFKQITDEDKIEFAQMLKAEGYELEPDKNGRW